MEELHSSFGKKMVDEVKGVSERLGEELLSMELAVFEERREKKRSGSVKSSWDGGEVEIEVERDVKRQKLEHCDSGDGDGFSDERDGTAKAEGVDGEKDVSWKLLVRAQECLKAVSCEPMVGHEGLATVCNPLIWLLGDIARNEVSFEVHRQAVEAMHVFSGRVDVKNLGIEHLCPLTRLLSVSKEITSHQFQSAAACVVAQLYAMLYEAKQNILRQPDLHAYLRLVLEIDALPLHERFTRIGELTSALSRRFLKRSPDIVDQLVAAVRVAIGWIEQLPSTLPSEPVNDAILNFKAAVLKNARYGLFGREIYLLRGNDASSPQQPLRHGLEPSDNSSEKFPSRHPIAILITELKYVRESKRNELVGELIAALKFDFADAPASIAKKYGNDLSISLRSTVSWILKYPIEMTFVGQYKEMCRVVQELATHMPEQKNFMLRSITPLQISLDWISTRGEASLTEKELDSENSMPDYSIENALHQILALKSQRQVKVGDIDPTIKMLDWIFKACKCTKNWNPRTDQRVRVLLIQLRKRTGAIPTQKDRKYRVDRIQRWLDDLPKPTHAFAD